MLKNVVLLPACVSSFRQSDSNHGVAWPTADKCTSISMVPVQAKEMMYRRAAGELAAICAWQRPAMLT